VAYALGYVLLGRYVHPVPQGTAFNRSDAFQRDLTRFLNVCADT
jgi:hypothetical protein